MYILIIPQIYGAHFCSEINYSLSCIYNIYFPISSELFNNLDFIIVTIKYKISKIFHLSFILQPCETC